MCVYLYDIDVCSIIIAHLNNETDTQFTQSTIKAIIVSRRYSSSIRGRAGQRVGGVGGAAATEGAARPRGTDWSDDIVFYPSAQTNVLSHTKLPSYMGVQARMIWVDWLRYKPWIFWVNFLVLLECVSNRQVRECVEWDVLVKNQ